MARVTLLTVARPGLNGRIHDECVINSMNNMYVVFPPSFTLSSPTLIRKEPCVFLSPNDV